MGRHLSGIRLVVCSALVLSALLFSTAACMAQLASGGWPKFRADISNTGRSANQGPGGDDLAWTYLTGGEIASSPSVAPNGAIYLVSRDGYLYALNPDGTMAWRYDIHATTGQSSPAVGTDGTIYVGSDDCSLYAINPDGTKKWSKGLSSQIQSSPTIGPNGTVYVGTNAGAIAARLYALDPTTGTTKWFYAAGGAIASSPAVGSDGTVYFTARNGLLYALTPAGGLRWTHGTIGLSESSPAIGSDGTIYFGRDDKKLYAISSSGALRWSYLINAIVRSSPAVGSDGTIYVGADDKYLYAFEPNGTLKWRYLTGGPVRSSPAVGSDGIIYFGSQDQYIYSLSPDGTLRWRHQTGGWVNSSPAISPEGQLYVGSLDRNVYAFRNDQSPPSTPVVTDDGAYSTSPNSLHAAWTSTDPETGIAEYQYAVGTQPGQADIADWTSAGTATEITRGDLTLGAGVVCYFSVKARNGAGMWSDIGVSDGIVVDYTHPTTPVVTDDGAFSTSSNTLHASWTSADPETGVVEYQYCIGTQPNVSDVLDWASAGTSTEISRGGLTLANGATYYFSVRARNAAGLWSIGGFSDGITIDRTPPSTPVVTDDGSFTSVVDRLHASWSTSDAESGITEYEYAVGTTSGGTDVVGWTSAGTAADVTITGLALSDGMTYYVSVRARNAAGLWSVPGNSDGITVDLSKPSTPTVTDDGSATGSPDTLHAVWASSDPQSGIAEYHYAIGTQPGLADIAVWTSAGTATEITRTGLALATGATYYFSVKSLNAAGLWSDVGMSDGILVDLTAPSTPAVIDDGVFTSSSDTLHAAWNAFDPETGVAEYQYCIGTQAGLDDTIPWTSAGTSTEVTRSGLSLANGTTYYFAVRARNAAGLWSIAGVSDGILVDRTPPGTPIVTDDCDFTSITDRLHASWTASDAESGIVQYEFAVGTTPGGTETIAWTSAGMATETTAAGLSLSDGAKYYVSVRARNAIGLWSGPGSSNGVTIDLSPPSTPIVTDDGDATYSFDTLHAIWASADAQSGIAEYEYAIGTAAGATDIVGWTSAANATQVTRTGLALSDGIPYFFAVRARNRAGLWSGTGVSDGIACTGASVWPKFRSDAANRGVSGYQGSKYGALLWQFPTFGWVESSPAFAGDGTVYIGSGDGSLYAIRRDGSLQWLFVTAGPVDSSPAIGKHGEVYVGSYDGNLYCLAPNGFVRWSYRTDNMIWSSPVIGPDDTIYFGSQDGYVYALWPDGTLRWRFNAGGAVWSSPALSDEGVIHFGSNDGCIYAVYADTGDLKWKYRTGTAVDSSPSVAPDGTVYAGSGDAYFYALRPDGTLKWQFFTGLPTDSSAAIGPDGTIYVGVGHTWTYGAIYALNPNGTKKWMYEVGGEVKSSPAIGADGTVYFGTGDGYVYALNASGTLKWRYFTGAAVLSSPAIHRDGTVCVGSYNGAVYAFKDADASDETPPTKPIVTDEGAGTLSTTSLSASWISTDPESGIAEYWYAIGTWPGTEDIVSWTQVGTSTSVARTDLHLVVGSTYYFSVKARNPARMWSQIGVSDGIVALAPGMPMRIGDAETMQDNTLIYAADKIAVARYSDCFYIEEPDRSAGVKVIPNGLPIPSEGSLVSLAGKVTTDNGESAILLSTIETGGGTAIPKPLGAVPRAVCIGPPADYRPGSPAPVGLELIGLLVTVRGRITASTADYVYIDDSSGVTDPSGIPGLKVRIQGLASGRTITAPPAGTWVRVTGVLSVERTGTTYRRVLRPRSQGDISVI